MLTGFLFSLAILVMLIIISYAVAKMVFVSLYGEQIRQLIINMPEYQPTWFGIVGLDKPIQPWQLIRANFFVIRLFGVVLSKRTSPINERFKSSLPQEVIKYLKVLRIMLRGGFILMIFSLALFYLTQPQS